MDIPDAAEARAFVAVELIDDKLVESDLSFSLLEVVTSSEGIDVGMAIEIAVTFPSVRVDVGIVASGDAVRGSLKISQISAIAPKVAKGKSASGRDVGKLRLQWQKEVGQIREAETLHPRDLKSG